MTTTAERRNGQTSAVHREERTSSVDVRKKQKKKIETVIKNHRVNRSRTSVIVIVYSLFYNNNCSEMLYLRAATAGRERKVIKSVRAVRAERLCRARISIDGV